MSEPLVTILLPHYKTLTLTKLCLRLLKQYTDPAKFRLIVIDNGSRDESSDYLKTLTDITLITREPQAGESPALSHSLALDQGLAATTTPYVLSIHTDTLMTSSRWLDFLLSHIVDQPHVAGVGSWKLEAKPLYKRIAKRIERYCQLAWYRLIAKKNHTIEGAGDNFRYLRSHCALYRTELLKQYQLSFAGKDIIAGKSLHQALIEKGYTMTFLPSDVLIRYLAHVNHATMVLNPELGARKKTIRQGASRIKKMLATIETEAE